MPAPQLPKDPGWMGDSRRGASMGRADRNPCYPVRKFYMERVRLNSGGYDSGGAYWGIGERLYWAHDYPGTHEFFVRGANRDVAKAAVRASRPEAEFYR